MLLDLIHNIALLTALAIALQMLAHRFEGRRFEYRLVVGLLFGLVGVIGMMTPVRFAPGVIYDGRSIVLSLAGLFGGAVPAAVAALFCGAYRFFYVGGPGAWVGTAVVVESAALGAGLHYLRRRNEWWVRPAPLLLFSLVVHAVMLALQLLLPGGMGLIILRHFGLPILLCYPAAFLLIAQVFLAGERQRLGVRALAESDERYRSLFENNHAVMVLVDPEDGGIVDVNPAAERYYGWSRAEMRRKKVSDVNTLTLDEIKQDMQAAREAQRNHFYFRHRLANGAVRDVEVYSGAIHFGERQLLFSIIHDITERNQIEDALRLERQRLEFIINGSRQGTWVWNVQTNATVFNETWAGIVGYTLEELAPCDYNTWKRLVHPDDLQKAQEHLARCVAGEKPDYECEFRMRHKDGHWVWISDRGRIMSYDADGKPLSMFGTHADITEIKQADKAIKEREQFLRMVLQTTPDGFFVLDNQGRFLEVNDAYCAMLGYTREEIIGRAISDVDATEAPEETAALIHRIIQSGSMLFEACHRRKDGHAFPVEVSTSFLPEHGGQFVCFCRDLSERKRAEEAQRISDEKYRSLFEQLADGVFVHDVNGSILDVNRAAVEQSGYSKEELLQSSVFDLHPSQSRREDILREWNQWAPGEGSVLESYHRTKNGDVYPVEIKTAKVHFGGQEAMLAVSRDITDRKRAADEIAHSYEMMRYIIEHTQSAVAVYDKDMNYIYVSQRFMEEYGIKEQDIIGRSHYDIFPDLPQKWRDAHQKALAGEITSAEDDPYYRADGTVDWSRWECRPWYEKNGVIGGIIIYTETITERKKSEEEREKLRGQLAQAQKMESVGRLAGGVAHDFNNMLNVILGYSEMALEDLSADSALRTDINEIKRAAERSSDLTRQLLAFARKQTVAPKILDINETVESLLKMLRRLIGEDIDLRWKPAQRLETIRIDPAQIDQLLANLVVNARDAIGHEAGKVTIETGQVQFDEAYCADHIGFIPGSYVMLAVSDNGCGMDEETKALVFEPFFTTKDVGEGTGLGLATVYGIVKQNQGFINVYSELGQGTTFRIYFPVSNAAKNDETRKQIPSQPVAKGHETILLVEDEPAILAMGTRMLERWGYHVLAASTPGEAICLAEKHADDIHLLITDVVMPDMNGRDLAKHLLSLYPNVKHLFMSGYTANVIAHQGVLDEGVNFLQKPFSQQSFGQKVREVLDS